MDGSYTRPIVLSAPRPTCAGAARFRAGKHSEAERCKKTEGRSEDVVALAPLRGLEEIRRQRLEPAGAELVVADRVEVLAVRLTGVEPLLDPVQARGEDRRRGEIGIRGAIDRAVFDPPRPRDAQHLRAIVVAVRDPDGRPGRAARGRAELQALVRVDGRSGQRAVGAAGLLEPPDEVV